MNSHASVKVSSTTTTHFLLLAFLSTIAWATTVVKTGMSYETSLINHSIDRGFVGGFLFPDQIRPFTSVSYHIAVQLASLLVGQEGSFFIMQCFFALMLVTRSLLLYTIIVRINLGKKDFALAASAILATYSADGSTLWIGQMNQIWAGTIALGSLILFFESFATNRTFRFRRVTIGLALCLQFLAIWSYDTIAAALMISSTGLLLIKRLSNWKLWSLYQILPVTYLIQFLSHMMKQGDEYRNSLISNETSINGILDNVMWMFGASLTGVVNSQNLTNIAFVVLGIFVTFTLVTTSRRRFQNIGNAEIYILFWLNRYSFKSFITLVLIAASLFAPFALLQDARSLWRTHLLAPLPLSILLAGSVFLFSNLFPRVSRDWVKITLTLLIVVPFLINQVERGEFHREIWKIHSSTLVKLDEKLSCGIPEDGLILVLKPDSSTDGNVRSPFGHNYWLKEAIKLRYSVRSIPPVAYVSTTGVLGPGVSFEDFEGNVPTLIHLDQEATDTLETLLRNKLASSGIKTVEYACSRNNIPVRIRWVS